MGVNVLDISELATTSEVLPRKGARDLRFWVLAWHMLSDVRCFSSGKLTPGRYKRTFKASIFSFVEWNHSVRKDCVLRRKLLSVINFIAIILSSIGTSVLLSIHAFEC